MDIEEKDNEYVVEAELPGINKEEVDIQLDDGRLTISIKREESKDIEEKNYIHKERRYSSMSRGVYLENIVNNDIKATLEDGVLCITIPKQEKTEEVKKISIE
ncbi:MAG: Hsp20/alpha crystallin family protein [Erysipelothrix sp.]|nr:Hsp20/alpha crystallin family protein [Erysipelothrix sp.]